MNRNIKHLHEILRVKEKLQQLYYSCSSMKEVAQKIGCGETLVHTWIHRLGIKPKLRPMTLKGKKVSKETRKKLSIWAKNRTGSKNPNWRNGATPKNMLIRGKQWRERRRLVLARDNYECTKCGSDLDLHVHHIKSVSEFPELVNELGNLLTLCEHCHYQLHFPKENLANSVEPQPFNRIGGVGNAEPSTGLLLANLLATKEFWKGNNLGACVETIDEKPIRL